MKDPDCMPGILKQSSGRGGCKREEDMKELSVISFTPAGKELSKKVAEALGRDRETALYHKSEHWGGDGEVSGCKGGVVQWTKEQIEGKRGIIFIGACGIAVRAVAPFVKDKLLDVPVLVMDEAGRFVIPILSGHYGGANELAGEIAGKTGAAAVITTATDVRGRFAADVFARSNHLVICNREGIKKVSAAILREEPVTITVEGDWEGRIPEELIYVPKDGGMEEDGSAASILVAAHRPEHMPSLWLCPKAFFIGIGCRKGKTSEEIEAAVRGSFKKLGIPLEAAAGVASIDCKQREKGLCEFADKYSLPFMVFSSEELKQTAGAFTSSSFVEEQVGVDNVCERSAVTACGGQGRLVLSKQQGNGITVAVAAGKWSVDFYEA